MIRRGWTRVAALALLWFLTASLPTARAQKPNVLTEDEEEKLREAQDPSDRIELYLAFAQLRLDRFEEFRKKPPGLETDKGSTLDSMLGQFISVNDEMKDWIDYQYQRGGDMRHGLRALLERGPRQLEQLRRIEAAPDPHAADYRDTLREAVEDLNDALDGATRALSQQQKKFAAEKRDEKATAETTKQRRKEEERRQKEEKKLRKREDRKKAPAERDKD